MRLEDAPVFYYPVFKGISRGSNAGAPVSISGPEDQILIDAGSGAGRRGQQYLELFQKDQLDIARTTKICITHPHPDHYRGIPFYRSAIAGAGGNPNVPVYLHPDGVKYLEDPTFERSNFLGGLTTARKEITKMSDNVLEAILTYLWGKKIGIDNVHPLYDGQVFDVGDAHQVKIIFTPGHAREHVGYLVDDHVMISGDLISFKKNDGVMGSLASLNNPLSDYILEVQTLEKLAGLNITTLVTGHYGIILGREKIHDYLIQAKQRVEEMLGNLQKTLKERHGPMRIKELKPKVIPYKHYLSGLKTREGTIFSLLNFLEQQGKVKRLVGPKAVTWSWNA